MDVDAIRFHAPRQSRAQVLALADRWRAAQAPVLAQAQAEAVAAVIAGRLDGLGDPTGLWHAATAAGGPLASAVGRLRAYLAHCDAHGLLHPETDWGVRLTLQEGARGVCGTWRAPRPAWVATWLAMPGIVPGAGACACREGWAGRETVTVVPGTLPELTPAAVLAAMPAPAIRARRLLTHRLVDAAIARADAPSGSATLGVVVAAHAWLRTPAMRAALREALPRVIAALRIPEVAWLVSAADPWDAASPLSLARWRALGPEALRPDERLPALLASLTPPRLGVAGAE